MDALQQTTTITEAARHWRKRADTIRRAIGTGRIPLQGRQSPDEPRGVWLIYVPSLVRRWGQPQIPLPPIE